MTDNAKLIRLTLEQVGMLHSAWREAHELVPGPYVKHVFGFDKSQLDTYLAPLDDMAPRALTDAEKSDETRVEPELRDPVVSAEQLRIGVECMKLVFMFMPRGEFSTRTGYLKKEYLDFIIAVDLTGNPPTSP
ncbi:hypothetical protein LK459_03900 [Gordonia otitidis]|uniref:hypothetical protein n=1 Tax=Gordonia otitidis TaxID=249058 RepID=UPI001D15718A|nr:hypothetical protein [Gordonia otitidis]UEA60035.1 hypothetical protein LK459_03900 [Gordonia otitidis]